MRATVRWAKYVVTFDDWLEFILRKARRHTGQDIVLTAARAALPLVFLWPRVFRYLRHKDRVGVPRRPLAVFVGRARRSRSSRWPSTPCAAGGRTPTPQRKGAQFLLGAGDFLVHWFMWVLGPVERALAAPGADARTSSTSRAWPAGARAGCSSRIGRLELGGWAIALGGVCDIMDGRIARARKLDSPYGKFIDSTLDRFVEVFALLGFVVFLRGLAVRAAAGGRRPGRLAAGELHARPRRVAGRHCARRA